MFFVRYRHEDLTQTKIKKTKHNKNIYFFCGPIFSTENDIAVHSLVCV